MAISKNPETKLTRSNFHDSVINRYIFGNKGLSLAFVDLFADFLLAMEFNNNLFSAKKQLNICIYAHPPTFCLSIRRRRPLAISYPISIVNCSISFIFFLGNLRQRTSSSHCHKTTNLSRAALASTSPPSVGFLVLPLRSAIILELY